LFFFVFVFVFCFVVLFCKLCNHFAIHVSCKTMESLMPTPKIKFKDFIPLITPSDFAPLSICDVASSDNHLDSSLHNNVEGCPIFVICLNDSRSTKLMLLIIYLSSSKGTKSMLSSLGLNVCPIKSFSIESLGGPIVNHFPTP
jgi:hypothetical protein